MSIYPLEDGEGSVTGALWHLKDNTDQRRAEEKLGEEITLEKLLPRQSRDGIVLLDQDGRVLETNYRFASMLGYSMEEAYGLQQWDWECQYTKEEVLAMLKAVDETGDYFESGMHEGALPDL